MKYGSGEWVAGLLISKLESASPRVAKVAETELLWLGAACIPVLRQVIRTGPWNARSRAVRVLGLLPDPEVISALTEAFREVSAAPTSTYLYADRDEDEEEWEPDAATALRLQIVKTLGSRRDPRILPFLLEVLQHPRWKERRAAAIELARWAGMDPVPALRTALPPLRLLIAGSGGGSTEPERYACRVALHRIEAVTAAIGRLPIPSGPGAADRRTLPIPSGDEEPGTA